MKVYKGRSGGVFKKRTETEFCVKDRSVSVLFYFVTVQRQAKFQRTGIKCLHF